MLSSINSNAVDMIRSMQRALVTNVTASSFTTKAPTTTEPTGNTIINLCQPQSFGGTLPQRVVFWPIGTGSDNDAFSLRVWSWRRIGSGDSPNVLWIPTILTEVSCTVCATVGVALSPVLATERFVDTITLVAARSRVQTGADGASATTLIEPEIFSPTNDLIGFFITHLLGSQKLELDFDETTNTPAANALYALL